MSDCSNAEIRDLLPELLHDRLDAPTRARVLAHVNGCADCRSELELLRSMRGALERGVPRVDVDRIVAALPSPASAGSRRQRRVWSDWRIAAAVTFLVAGGTSLAVLRNARDDAGADSTSVSAARHPSTVAALPAPDTSTPSNSPANAGASNARGTPQSATPNRAQTAVAPRASRGGKEALASTDEQAGSTGLGNSRLDDLNARQLKSLLNDIDHLDATPVTDPEPVTLRVGPRSMSPTGL